MRPGLRPVALVAAAVLVAGCTGAGDGADDGASTHEHDHVHTSGTSLGQPDAPIAGPQGNQPQFVVTCGFSHAAPDDPIVSPGKPGESHLHVFFGNTEVDADTTTDDLVGGDTTCDHRDDTAAYWAPALLRDGEPLEPVTSTAYYRPGLGVDPASVQAYPPGLVMVAGNAGATEAQPVSIVAWSCGVGIEREPTPPTCGDSNRLRLVVTFPDCWDGQRLDSPDHHAHVAYSSGGECPEGYPVPVPQLQFSVEYPVTGDPSGLLLASGGLLTGHADFMNGWDQAALEREVALCLGRALVCGVSDGAGNG